MAEINVDTIADWFIVRSREVGDPITNLKLQKLVYYAQAWYVALYDKPLVRDEFQAWLHGPVSPRLYHRFKAARWRPIEDEITEPELPPEVKEHLEEIMEQYGGFSAWDLERLTHTETPWIEARKDVPSDANCENPISLDAMRSYYSSLLRDGSK